MRARVPLILSLIAVPSLLAQKAGPRPNYGEPNTAFPVWQERVVHQLANRARVDPAAELAGCPPGRCLEAACYAAKPPVAWAYALNRSARFHSASMARFPFFAHDTPCALFVDIATRYPGTSDGSRDASCVPPVNTGTTTYFSRIGLFGASASAENIAPGSNAHSAFYLWLYETATSAACTFRPDDGHRWNILMTSSPNLGVGYDSAVSGFWTLDIGSGGVAIPKVPSGSHWTTTNHLRDPGGADLAVEFWTNWYDVAGGPTQANLVLDANTTALALARGTTTNGAYTATVPNVASGCHTYYFSFVDSAMQAVRYPTTGYLGFGTGCTDWQLTAPPATPAGLNAAATSSTQVNLTWSVVGGATSYEVYRRVPGGSFGLIGSPGAASFSDMSAAANTSYLYRVRAVGAGGSSPDSAHDLATTVAFSNDPLTPGSTINAAHLAELRTAANAVRAQANLPPATFTDAATPGVPIREGHINELRSSVDAAMALLGLTTGGYTDIIAAGTLIKAVHFQEIRIRVK